MVAEQEEWLCAGRITGAYGIKGWVHIASFTDPKENIERYSPWQLGRQADQSDIGKQF